MAEIRTGRANRFERDNTVNNEPQRRRTGIRPRRPGTNVRLVVLYLFSAFPTHAHTHTHAEEAKEQEVHQDCGGRSQRVGPGGWTGEKIRLNPACKVVGQWSPAWGGGGWVGVGGARGGANCQKDAPGLDPLHSTPDTATPHPQRTRTEGPCKSRGAKKLGKNSVQRWGVTLHGPPPSDRTPPNRRGLGAGAENVAEEKITRHTQPFDGSRNGVPGRHRCTGFFFTEFLFEGVVGGRRQERLGRRRSRDDDDDDEEEEEDIDR